MSLEVIKKGATLVVRADGKLDTCGSVSLAHSSFMRDIAKDSHTFRDWRHVRTVETRGSLTCANT
jgi:hypothetical protein